MAPTSPRKKSFLQKSTPSSTKQRRSTSLVSRETRSGEWPWRLFALDHRQLRIVLIGILIAAGFFRATGRNWDALTGLHPDERFFAMTAADLRPLAADVGYFDTARSTLNPSRNNVFFVYGTLPLFAMRWLNDLRGENGMESLLVTGRILSTIADLGTTLLTFVLGRWWYGTAVGLGAAALFALAILPIQLSHFFPVDPFATFFVTLSLLTLARLLQTSGRAGCIVWRNFTLWSVAFGVSAGAAAASKIYGALVLACYLPTAWLVWEQYRPRRGAENAGVVFHLWLGVLAVALLVFRVAQPYAFSGPGFFGLSLNPQWVADLQKQYSYSSEFGSYPPTLQWIDRPRTFALVNLVYFGFAPLGGLLAMGGLLWMGTRLLRNREWGHAPLWFWTTGFLLLFGFATRTPMQRYLLPIYPCFALVAAWVFGELWNRANRQSDARRAELGRRSVAIAAGLTLLTSFVAAIAFTSIYRRPVTRLQATEWLLHNAPGPINVSIQTMNGMRQLPLPVPYAAQLTDTKPYQIQFTAHTAGEARTVLLPHLIPAGSTPLVNFTLRISDRTRPNQVSMGTLSLKLDSEQAATFTLEPPFRIERNHDYSLELSIDKPHVVFHLEGTRIAHETGWDDLLPIRWSGVEDIGPIDPFGGIYPADLDLDAYSSDTHNKLERIAQILERSELLTLTSQRQWGVLPRLPTKYPLMTRFYQKLIGCPSPQLVVDCYARPHAYDLKPALGYRLKQQFRSVATLGQWQFDDSKLEESLSVYDHPPVMIFENQDHLSLARMRELLDGPLVP